MQCLPNAVVFLTCQLQARAEVVGAYIQPHHAILNGFLIFLYCLHVYWCVLSPCFL